jgi:outer membrane protein assembly factor BamB
MVRSRQVMKPAAALLCVLLLFLPLLAAQDWPQWRGPNRDGSMLTFAEPKAWPDRLQQTWQVNVGIGHSTPLLVNKRIYVFARQGDMEIVSCLDFDTGKQIWRDAYAAPYTVNPVARAHGTGPKSTPLFHAGKLFTLGISGIFSSYEAESGKLRWRREFSAEFKSTSPYFGTATSPVGERGLVIVHVGGHDSGALTAFDAETGKTVWSWNGDGPAYASPIVVTLGDTRQIVTQSQKNIIGVSAADGKLLWRIPFTTAYVQNIITPVLFKDTLIFSGLDKGVMAIRLAKSGGEWKPEKIWENPAVAFYMSNPVLNHDVLFGMSHKNQGQFVALDAATGKTLWTSAGREGENAALVSAGDKLFLLTNDAELIVAKASRTAFEPLRRYTVANSPTWANPLFSGKCILIKDAETLTLWSLE